MAYPDNYKHSIRMYVACSACTWHTIEGTIVKLKKIAQVEFCGSFLSFNIAFSGVNDSFTAMTKLLLFNCFLM